MLSYTLRKLLHTAFVALGVVTLAFCALRLSGDPAATMLPGDASVEELQALRHALGLDQSLPTQYLRFLTSAVHGDFGLSFRHQQPALAVVLERLPATLELALASLSLSVVIAIPLGILAALYRGRLCDAAAMAFAVVGQATPYFWMGIMLILVTPSTRPAISLPNSFCSSSRVVEESSRVSWSRPAAMEAVWSLSSVRNPATSRRWDR